MLEDPTPGWQELFQKRCCQRPCRSRGWLPAHACPETCCWTRDTASAKKSPSWTAWSGLLLPILVLQVWLTCGLIVCNKLSNSWIGFWLHFVHLQSWDSYLVPPLALRQNKIDAEQKTCITNLKSSQHIRRHKTESYICKCLMLMYNKLLQRVILLYWFSQTPL